MIVASQIRHHQSRCQPHLLRLRMVALGETGTTLPWQAIVEIREATNAIIAEAEAGSAALAAVAADRGERESETFLLVRLNRLAVAADEAVNAARGGDGTRLRRQLARFDALTSAIWAVQHAIDGSGQPQFSPR
jgi:hypothetical protein